MAQLRWTLATESDLIEIGDFIARDSLLYAVSVVDRLLVAAETLSVSPRAGRVVPEYSRDDLRELIVKNYRLVHLVRGDEVVIVRVLHGARDFQAALGPQPWLIA